MKVEVVTFDFWNTIMWEAPGSLREHRLACWRSGVEDVDPQELAAAHDAAHDAYVMAWKAGRQFVVDDAARLMGSRLPDFDHKTLVEGFCEGGRRAAIALCPGIGECLCAFRRAGIGLGIICDIGLTPAHVVRELLEREGLLHWFDHMAFSDEVGHYKPAPEIFALALRHFGAEDLSRVVHVGDRTRTDIAGALGIGVTPIRYTGIYDDPDREPAAHMVLDDLVDLPIQLELGVR